jgi:hypothetical protein
MTMYLAEFEKATRYCCRVLQGTEEQVSKYSTKTLTGGTHCHLCVFSVLVSRNSNSSLE